MFEIIASPEKNKNKPKTIALYFCFTCIHFHILKYHLRVAEIVTVDGLWD